MRNAMNKSLSEGQQCASCNSHSPFPIRHSLFFILHALCFTFLLIALAMTISACSDSRRFRLSGDINNLEQAEFYIYSPDGGLDKLDTITVEDGKFKWETLINHEVTFFLVYPNLSRQVIFARPGDDVRILGDASQLRAINVLGSDENKAYTEFRMAHFNDKPKQLLEAMNEFIAAHPESRVSTYMTTLRTASTTNGASMEEGQKLPNISLPPDGITSDSTTIEIRPGRPVLLTFWASWLPKSKEDFFYILKAYNQAKQLTGERKVRPISISLDASADSYRSSLKYDSLVWESRCYRQLWDTPVVTQLSVTSLPYYILTDAKLNIIASGSNFHDDIQRTLYQLTLPRKE